MRRLLSVLLLFIGLVALVNAASESVTGLLTINPTNRHTAPTSFCKCTCFSNSTIIPLNGGNQDDTHHALLLERAPTKHRTCNDCNRNFCLDQNLPICKGATDADVFTTCFQRDSAKDKAVVYIFIFATVGLLVWAVIRPWAEPWIEVWINADLPKEQLLNDWVESQRGTQLRPCVERRSALMRRTCYKALLDSRYPYGLYNMLQKATDTTPSQTLCS